VRIYGRLHELRPGYFYLIPAFVAHEDILRGTFTHQYLHFRLDDSYLLRIIDEYEPTFEIPGTPLLRDIFDRIAELCRGFELETDLPQAYEKKSSYIYWSQRYDNMSLPSKIEIGGYIRILLSSFISHSKKRQPVKNPRVAQGRLFMDRYFSEPIIIEEVAGHVGMRAESFIRAFRQEYNRTPHAYLMEKRINRAKNLLLLSSKSVKEVAGACGFKDSSYFCLMFKKYVSLSPGEFRRGGGI